MKWALDLEIPKIGHDAKEAALHADVAGLGSIKVAADASETFLGFPKAAVHLGVVELGSR